MLQRASQLNRHAKLETPLGDDVLLFHRLSGREALSELFFWRVEAFSEDEPLNENDLLGQACTVSVDANDEEVRYFHGICADVIHLGHKAEKLNYEILLRPHLWFLTLQMDSRIFSKMTVCEIVQSVLDSAGVSDVKISASADYETIDYCVQYQETNFDFICRLMEKYGLFYFFEHREDKHTLIITDSPGDLKPVPGYAEVPFSEDLRVALERDRITKVTQSGRIRPDEIEVNDYNYETASSKITGVQSARGEHKLSGNALYDFRLGYGKRSEGETLARVILEAERVRTQSINADGTTIGLTAGCQVKILDAPLPESLQPLACVAAEHLVISDTYVTGNDEDVPPYEGRFQFIPWQTPFRAPKVTPWPRIAGHHRAVVVGKEGEEIDVDEQGRILVHFHWEREGKPSCRVRVCQPIAGKGYGIMNTPRIGHEVLVSYVDGDPDRPEVIASTYNSTNKPPLDFPANKTQNGLRSNSSKGGGGANEMVMDDKKDQETFSMIAERDLTQTVKNDATMSIGFEKAAPGNFVQKVKQDWTQEVETGNHSLTVKTGNHDVTVQTGNQSLTVASGTSTVTVKAGREVTIQGGGDKLDVTGERSVKASVKYGAEAPAVTMNGTTSLGVESPSVKINGKTTTKIGSSKIEVDGKTVSVNGATEILLAVGGSSIKLDASGVTIAGPLVKIN